MGFSIGFKVLQKIGNTYTKIKIFEISAVDIPANYSALIGSKSYNPLLKEESMDTVEAEVSAEDLQDLNKEALELVQEELNKVKAELEAVTKAKNELEIEVKSFEKTKEVAKSFKSLNIIHEKFKQENSSLKSKVAELEAEISELKSKEVNIKTSVPEDVKEKSVDFSKFEVKQAPAEVYNATAILKAKLFKE